MAVKLSVAVRNARLNALEAAIGASAVLRIFTGPPPASITDPNTGTLLATLNLPADWMAAASGGTASKSGTWEDLSADDTGSVGHFRIYASDGTTQHMQGTVTFTGLGGDMIVNNPFVVAGVEFTVTAFTITDGNA